MQNNTFRGNSTNRGPLSGRRQQARTSQTYSDKSHDGREALLVQRSRLVDSSTGLKAKCFVNDESRGQNANGRSSSYVRDSIKNNVQGKEVAPRCPGQTRSRNNRQVGSETRYNNATNNSSNKRSYFEPYDARRSPRGRRNHNIENHTQTNPAGAYYMAPQQLTSATYRQQTRQQPQYPYNFIQSTNAATAVAPNGQTIYIPLDYRQYEVKNVNHDMELMPEQNNLPPLNSPDEFERNTHLITSPRPVHLKGGLLQDSDEDSGDSSDEISYGEPDSDTGSDDEKRSDVSEYAGNCVSEVMKSVQGITIEESKDIVERAVKEFKEAQEASTGVSLSEVTNHNQINNAEPETKNETKRLDTTNSIFRGADTFVTETQENCFGMIGYNDSKIPKTSEETKSRSSGEYKRTETDDSDHVQNSDTVHSDIVGKPTPEGLQNELLDPSIIAISASQSRIAEDWTWQLMPTTDVLNCNRNIPQCIYKLSDENDAEFKNECFGMNKVTYFDTLDSSKINRHLNEHKPEVIMNKPDILTNKPEEITNASELMTYKPEEDTCYFSKDPISVHNDWLLHHQQNNKKTNDASDLNSFDRSNMQRQVNDSNPEVRTNQAEMVKHQCSMDPISMQKDWLLPQQQNNLGTNDASHLNSFDSSNMIRHVNNSSPEVSMNQTEVVNQPRLMDHISTQNEWLNQQNISNMLTNDVSYLNSYDNFNIARHPDVSMNQPEVVYSPHCMDGNCSPIPVQNEWIFLQQNIDSVDQILSPLAYGPMEEDAVYIPGDIMIDGQGYFQSSDPQNGQNETLYIPANCTFQEHQPALVSSISPTYTYFIHDACPPPPPEVVCHPLHKSVSGELISVTGATAYESKNVTESNDNEYTNQACVMQQPRSPTCDTAQSERHADYPYSDGQTASPINGNCVTLTGQTMNDTWDTDVSSIQQNERQDNLGSKQTEDESTGQYDSQSGQFFVSYDEESVYTDPQSGLSYPAIHMTEDCLITVIFREGVCLEISADKSMRLVNHEKKLVAAMTGNGERACVIHPAARIYQSETIVNAALYSNRRAKLSDEFITFGNDTNSYMFDQKVIKPVDRETNFMDLSGDESVNFLYTDDGLQPNSEKMRQRNVEILTHAHFWKHGKCGSTVIINGTKVVQSDKGDVSVYCGPIKFMRMNPKRSVIRLKTQLFEADIETNWNVKLTRGHLALNVSHLGLIVSNGKIKGCIDNDDKLQAFSLPDHRVLMLGQAISQHRPGVPSWSRRRNHNRRTEPEDDHSAYARPIVIERVNRPRHSPGLEWR